MLDWTLYRGHFTAPEMDAVWSEAAAIAAWLRFEQALAEAQVSLGVIPAFAAKALDRIAPGDIDTAELAEDMILVGRPIVGLVKQLRRLVGPEAAPFVHFRCTTPDVMDSGTVQQMAAGLGLIDPAIGRVIAGLESLVAAHGGAEIMARTNGQHALPIRLSTKLGIWIAELTRRRAVLAEAARRGLSVQHVGPVGEFTGYPPGEGEAVRARVAAILGLGVTEPHWQNARDGIADVVVALGALCASLCKIAHNVNLLCGSDLAEMRERYTPGRGASSAMAHKANPRASEFGEAVARLGRQRAEQIGEVMGVEHERAGGVWIAEWVIVAEVFRLSSGALHWAEKLVTELEIDTDRMAATVAEFRRSVMPR